MGYGLGAGAHCGAGDRSGFVMWGYAPYWTGFSASQRLVPVRTVAPTKLVVEVEEAKAQLRYEDGDKDDHIRSLLEAAIEDFDGYSGELGRALCTQTWKLNVCAWPCAGILLPLAPVQSVTTVKYYDAANNQQTFLATNNWALLTDALAPRVTWLSTVAFPGTYCREDAIEVTFVAGYGEPEDVPASIRAAIKLRVERLFGNLSADDAARIENTERSLTAKFRRIPF